MNISSVNLNLLVAFDALLAERHVTRAAARIGVTQGAMSNSLRQLRALFGDPLFIRGARGVTPTARALALGRDVREGLSRLESALGEPSFDPKTSAHTFVLAASDFVELVVLPPLLARLAKEAPNVRLDVRPWGKHEVPDLRDADLALGFFDRIPPKHRVKKLFEEPFACIVRKGHPAVKQRLTAKIFASIPHVVVSESRDVAPTAVDRALAAVGLTRTVALRVSHFLLVPKLVASTDLAAAISRRVATAFDLPLAVHAPPVDLPPGKVAMVWHESTERDPALRYLRGLVESVARTLP